LVGILFIYNSSGSLCLFLLCVDISLAGGLLYVCWFLPFWLGCLYLLFICDSLGLMLRLLFLVL
jgi:hypothetical protein